MIKYLIENKEDGRIEVTAFDFSAKMLGVINVFDTLEEAVEYIFMLDGRGLQTNKVVGYEN